MLFRSTNKINSIADYSACYCPNLNLVAAAGIDFVGYFVEIDSVAEIDCFAG